ncbi:MAG TPA: hypothetical protein VF516_11010, partial [Kofleriaceae bacterium]
FVTADAAVCAAGSTLAELAYLGCPALGFAIVPDQVLPATSQARGGLIAGGREPPLSSGRGPARCRRSARPSRRGCRR